MKNIHRISFILICFVSILFYSCKDEEKTTDKDEAVVEESSPAEMKEDMAKSADTKFNPAHGVEGHRCDLPVGAPLNNANASSKLPEMNTSPVRLQSATPKINPAHGQPGHDCSVPVGAELEG